jgi:hypothetical protein
MPSRFLGQGPSRFPYEQIAAQRQSRMVAILSSPQRNQALLDGPSILLQAVLIPGDKTTEGQLVEAVALPWFDIIDLLGRSPEAIYELDWRKWEEIVAAAYKQQGFDVGTSRPCACCAKRFSPCLEFPFSILRTPIQSRPPPWTGFKSARLCFCA